MRSVQGGFAVTYGYAGMGRRVRTDQGTGAVIHYVYHGDDLLLKMNAGGAVLRQYGYYPGVDTPTACATRTARCTTT